MSLDLSARAASWRLALAPGRWRRALGAHQIMRGVALSSLCLILATLLTSLLGYVYWVAAARLFSPYLVGHLAAVISAMLLIETVGGMGMGLGVAYVLPKAGDRWGTIVASVLATAVVCSAALALAFIVGAAALGLEIGRIAESPAFVAVFVLICAVWTASVVLDQILTVEGAAPLLLVRNVANSLVRLALLPAIILLAWSESELALAAAWGISTALATALAIALFARRHGRRRRLAWRVDLGAVREVLPLSLSNHVLTTIDSAPSRVLPLLVAGVLSVEANAYFYTTWMVAFMLFTIPSSTGVALFAHGASAEELSRATLFRILGLTLGVCAPLAAAAIALRELVLGFFGPAYVENGGGLLVALACAALPMAVCQIYVSVQRARRRFRRSLCAASFVTLATLVGAALAIDDFGLPGVGMAVLLGNGLAALACFWDLWLRRPAAAPSQPA